MRLKAWFWSLFAFSVAAFFTPLALEERVGLGLDKVVHVGLFFLLVYFAFRAYPQRKVSAVFLLLAYAVATEFVQENFIPNRGFDVFDIVADALGIVAGSVYFVLWIGPRGDKIASSQAPRNDGI